MKHVKNDKKVLEARTQGYVFSHFKSPRELREVFKNLRFAVTLDIFVGAAAAFVIFSGHKTVDTSSLNVMVLIED